MARTLLALVVCLLVQFPNRTCACGAAEHTIPAGDADPHEHHDDCPASQPIPKWKAVKPAPADLPLADAGPAVTTAVATLTAEPGAVFVPAAPPPPGVPIYLSVCVLRN